MYTVTVCRHTNIRLLPLRGQSVEIRTLPDGAGIFVLKSNCCKPTGSKCNDSAFFLSSFIYFGELSLDFKKWRIFVP
jgi:hypothetical protein